MRENVNSEPLKDGQFLEIHMRMEKLKENFTYREYVNMASVIAQVGGILKVSMMIFFAFNHLYSKKQFHLNLVNDLFSFDYNENNKNNNNK